MSVPRSTRPIAAAVLLAGCSLSPLNRKIAIGEEPFVAFVAEGPDGRTDLFASAPTGGTPVRITFTAMRESHPRLTSRGDVVAFVRDRLQGDGRDLVVMNLLNGAERVLELPPEAGVIERLGWSRDETALYVSSTGGRWRVTAPPAPMAVELLSAPAAAAADSAIAVLLGTPSFARAESCADGGICVVGPSGEPSVLSATGTDPFRWGSDSVAWFDGDEVVIRSLGPGAARRIAWEGVTRPREGSYATPQQP